MLKKELIKEINECLQRNDLTQLDFVYLHVSEYLIAKVDEIIGALCFIAGLLACGFILLAFPPAFN